MGQLVLCVECRACVRSAYDAALRADGRLRRRYRAIRIAARTHARRGRRSDRVAAVALSSDGAHEPRLRRLRRRDDGHAARVRPSPVSVRFDRSALCRCRNAAAVSRHRSSAGLSKCVREPHAAGDAAQTSNAATRGHAREKLSRRSRESNRRPRRDAARFQRRNLRFCRRDQSKRHTARRRAARGAARSRYRQGRCDPASGTFGQARADPRADVANPALRHSHRAAADAAPLAANAGSRRRLRRAAVHRRRKRRLHAERSRPPGLCTGCRGTRRAA